MALITPGSIIGGLKGSIGGTTFSGTRGGTIAKIRLTGKRAMTQKQAIAIQNNINVVKLWENISLSDKLDWNDFALVNPKIDRYGVSKGLTGFNWFQSINTSRIYTGLSIITSPPEYAIPDALPEFIIGFTPENIAVQWSTPIDEEAVQLYVYSTPPIKGTSGFKRGSYRLHNITPSGYSELFDITANWEEAHRLDWAQVAYGAKFNINVAIFATNLSNGITGPAVTSVNQFIY